MLGFRICTLNIFNRFLYISGFENCNCSCSFPVQAPLLMHGILLMNKLTFLINSTENFDGVQTKRVSTPALSSMKHEFLVSTKWFSF